MRAVSPPTEAAALGARIAILAGRTLEGEARREAIALAVACVDLTTLEGRDTPGRVRALCAQARHPGPGLPPVAAVCVYPALAQTAHDELAGTAIRIASVATAFPSGLSSLAVKLADVDDAIACGANEIDMVIDRGAFLAGDERRVTRDIRAVKERCGDVVLKVILETGELGSFDAIRRACDLALAAGADFIKTSTGKIPQAATPRSVLVMAQALRDFHQSTGERRGLKIAGGVRSAAAALAYLVSIKETLGDDWLHPSLFRFGASTLLAQLVEAYG